MQKITTLYKLIAALLLFLLHFDLEAQNVINSNGGSGTYANGSIQLDWTVGESVVGVGASTNYQITHGFLQPSLKQGNLSCLPMSFTMDSLVNPPLVTSIGACNPNFGCLTNVRNISYKWIQTSSAGEIHLKVEAVTAANIDFAVWGPFNDAPNACTYLDFCALNIAAPIICDVNPVNGGDINITNVSAQSYYLIGIVNTANKANTINISKRSNNTVDFNCGLFRCISAKTTACLNDSYEVSGEVVLSGITQTTSPLFVSSSDGFATSFQAPLGQSYSYRFTGLAADGAAKKILANVLDAQSSKIEKSYTAPATCTQTVNQRALINPNFDYNSTYEAGYTNGSLNISDMGSASYSIQLLVPSGAGGMQPSLSFSYNSNGENGTMGLGWALGGLSMITRSGNSDDVDDWTYGVSYTRQKGKWANGTISTSTEANIVDKLNLDGEKLIQTNYDGTVNNRVLKGGAEYRTQNNNFSRILAVEDTLNGPKKFKVWTKAGLIYEYGYTQNSRIESARLDGSDNAVSYWLVNKISDVRGNYLTFEYNEFPTGFLIDKIRYTGNATNTPKYSVNFYYQTRSDSSEAYMDSRRTNSTKLLNAVVVKYNLDTVRQYKLTYNTSGLSPNAKLIQIQECGMGNKCLQPTKFIWEDEKAFALQAPLTSVLGPSVVGNIDDVLVPADFNGDGLVDYAVYNTQISGSGGAVTFYQNQGNLSFIQRQSINIDNIFANQVPQNRNPSAPYLSMADVALYFQDMNGDNATDMFVVDHKNGYNLILSSKVKTIDRSTFFFNTSPNSTIDSTDIALSNYTSDFSATSISAANRVDIFFPDIDANGIPEIFTRRYSTGDNNFFVRTYGSNTNYVKSQTVIDVNKLKEKEFTFMDLNRDGRDEIVQPFKDANSYGLSYISFLDPIKLYLTANTGRFAEGNWIKRDTVITANSLTQYSFADLNGDFLPDIQHNFPTTTATNPPIRTDIYINKLSLGTNPTTPFTVRNYSMLMAQDVLPIFRDFTVDGKADLILYNATTGRNLWYLNKGGLQFQLQWTNLLDSTKVKDFPPSISSLKVDSYSDISWINQKRDQTYIDQNRGRPFLFWQNSYAPSRKIYKIIDGFGSTTTINYSNLTDKEVYSSHIKEKTFKNVALPNSYPINNNTQFSSISLLYVTNPIEPFEFTGKMGVVKNYEIDNGLGNVSRVKYNYEMAVVSRAGAGFRGFGKTIITDVNSGYTTYNMFDLDKTGAMRMKTTLTALDDVALTISTNTDQTDLLSFTQPEYQSSGYTLNYANNVRQYKVFNSFTKENTLVSYDLDGTLVSTLVNKLMVDIYANTTSTETIYSDGHSEKTTNFYNNYTSAGQWILGRLYRSEAQRKAPNASIVTRVIAFEYEPSGLLTKEILEPDLPLNKQFEKSYEYDAFGNTKKVTSKFFNGTQYVTRSVQSTFDATGKYDISTTNDLGHTVTKTFDPKTGHPLTVTDPNGLTTTYEYDSFGRQTKTTTPDGNWSKTDYLKCSTGNCPDAAVFYTVETNSITTFVSKSYFDKFGREVKSEDPGWNGQTITTENKFNHKGQPIAKCDPYFANEAKRWSTIIYDKLGREITTIDAGGMITSTAYNGLTKTVTNPLGQKKTSISAENGRVKKIIDNQGNELTFAYDSQGNVVSTTYPGGNSITAEYDIFNRLTKSTDPDMGTYTYEYNSGGELLKQTDPKGNIVTMEYDILGRTTRINNPEFYTIFTYDVGNKAIGKLSSKVQRTTGTTTGYITQESYTFDNLGRASSSTTNYVGDPTVYICSTEYDAQSRVLYTNAPGPNGANASIKYEYNAESRMIRIRNKANNKVYWELSNLDSKGNMRQFKMADAAMTTNLNYDANFDFLLDISTQNAANQNIQHLTYDYNLLAMPTQRTDVKNSMTEKFQYDNLNRLLSAEVVGKQTMTMTYDVLGNILTKSDVGTYTYGQNGAGPHVLTNIALNSNKCIPSALVKYNYTSFNKVKSMVKGLDSMFIDYDDSKQRFRQMTYRNNALVKTKRFVTCGLEREVTATNTKDIYYISSPTGIVAVETFNSNTSLPAKTEYWLKDNLGSLQTVISPTGVVIQTLSYDPWGKRRNADGTAIDTTITGNQLAYDRGFTGHEHLDLFDLINMNGRVYDPMLGRFISADPFIQYPDDIQGYNRFAYIQNNPLSATDPSGYRLSKWAKSLGSIASNIVKGNFKAALNESVAHLMKYSGFNEVNKVGMKAFGAEKWSTMIAIGVTLATSGMGGPIAFLVSGAISTYASTTAVALANGATFSKASTAGWKAGVASMKPDLKAMAINFVAQQLTTGVGDLAQGKDAIIAVGIKVVGHAVVQGAYAEATGGKFKDGALVGAVMGGTEDLIGRLPASDGVKRFTAAMVGGTAAEMGGGNFANGASAGMMVYMYNHEQHNQEKLNQEKHPKCEEGEKYAQFGKTSLTFFGIELPIIGPLFHEQLFFCNDGTWDKNIGYFPGGVKNGGEYTWNYEMYGPKYNYDSMMNRTNNYDKSNFNSNNYNILLNNCQDFGKSLKDGAK